MGVAAPNPGSVRFRANRVYQILRKENKEIFMALLSDSGELF